MQLMPASLYLNSAPSCESKAGLAWPVQVLREGCERCNRAGEGLNEVGEGGGWVDPWAGRPGEEAGSGICAGS